MNYTFKVAVIGDSGVGKSSIIKRFMYDSYTDQFTTTIGIDYVIKHFDYQNKNIKLQIWDTAGQERFKSITSAHYRGSHCVLFVYDVNCSDSFYHLLNWMKDVNVDDDANKDVLKILVGNKSDMKKNVSDEEVKKFAAVHNLLFIETSAKTANNVNILFRDIVIELVKKRSAEFNKFENIRNDKKIDVIAKKNDSECCVVL